MIKLSSKGCLEEEVISVVGTMQNGVGSRRVDLSLIHKSSVKGLWRSSLRPLPMPKSPAFSAAFIKASE